MQGDTYMSEAFRLAERGRGLTHPNPLVGAVLVADGQVVGRGWHRGPGTEHAEAVALREAGTRAAGATLFCTLEPCSHQGNTPPCADALVAAGILRAVIALRDPNPLVDGRGLTRLREGGVAVEVLDGAAAASAERQNAAFLKYVRIGLPSITYKAAVSLDGKVAASNGSALAGSRTSRAVAGCTVCVLRPTRSWSAPAPFGGTIPSSRCVSAQDEARLA